MTPVSRRRLLQSTLGLTTCGIPASRPEAADTGLRLATLPVVSARTAYDLFRPLVEHLRARLGPLPVSLETPPTFRAMYQRLVEGHYDLLLSPPHIARLAQRRLGWHPLAALEPGHQAVLLVTDDGPVRQIEALRGATIAVLDKGALVVMVMLDALAQRGLVAGRDFKVLETRSYDSSLIALRQGVAQAMVFRSRGFLATEARERLTLLLVGGNLPGYVFIAATPIAAPTRERWRAELLAFGATPAGTELLGKLGYSQMVPAREEVLRSMDAHLEATEASLS